MIGLDLDGTLLNYGNHTTELRINHALIAQLSKLTKQVVILTNQGGLVWHESNHTKYPSPERFVERAAAAIAELKAADIRVANVHVSLYHPRADESKIRDIYFKLDSLIVDSRPFFWFWLNRESRKPEISMFKQSLVKVYYGDSDEDEAASGAYGCKFVRVTRFE